MSKVLITGGAIRLGAALAELFSEKKWDVGIHYNNSTKEAIELKNKLVENNIKSEIFKADLTSYENTKSVMESANNFFDGIDVLICNAGIFPERKTLNQLTDKNWNNTLDINLNSVFYCSKEFARLNPVNSRIIIISSLGGIKIWKNRLDYNISKTSSIQLSKALARELAPDISVNCICPGVIEFKDSDSNNQINIKNNIPSELKIPMKRYARPEDIFDGVYFFATASSYITGQVLIIDGGLNLI